MPRGQFITFEGIDGCGKSTHIRMLGEALAASGTVPLVTREPGGTFVGERVRGLLLTAEGTGLIPVAELLLYAADRAQHVATIVRPALDSGRSVLCDRYIDSTVAFQGYGRGVEVSTITDLNRIATGGLLPDLTLLLDVDPLIARRRLDKRRTITEPDARDRFDEEAGEFHSRVREGYLKMAAAEPRRFTIVDSSGPVEVTQARILSIVMSRLC
jgi:dTMP kinase